jgi:hypothetical protein
MLKCPNCNATEENIEIYDVMDIEFNNDNSKIRTYSNGSCNCCGAFLTWKTDYVLSNIHIIVE